MTSFNTKFSLFRVHKSHFLRNFIFFKHIDFFEEPIEMDGIRAKFNDKFLSIKNLYQSTAIKLAGNKKIRAHA